VILGLGVPALKPLAYTFARLLEAYARRLALLGGALVAADALASRRGARTATAMGLCAFLALAPGIGFQYVVAPLPALAALRPRLAAVYGVLAGGFLLSSYLSAVRSWRPIDVYFIIEPLPRGAVLLGLGAWYTLIVALARLRRRTCRSASPRR
jgi:hypothetical protein